MVLTHADGTILADGTEQDLFSINALNVYACTIYLHNMAANDRLIIRTYVFDENAVTFRLYDTVIKANVQDNPAWYSPPMPTLQYKVSIEQTDGTNRNYTWVRHEF